MDGKSEGRSPRELQGEVFTPSVHIKHYITVIPTLAKSKKTKISLNYSLRFKIAPNITPLNLEINQIRRSKLKFCTFKRFKEFKNPGETSKAHQGSVQ